ncbi:MAG: DUF502 domain-containing protein [Halieaceae bacterium]
MKFVMKPLVTGIIALLPIALTLGVLAWIVSLMAGLFGPASPLGALFRNIGWSFGSTEIGAYLGGVLFTLLLVYLLGIFVQLGLRSSWELINNSLMSRIPIIRNIYEASSKVTQLLDRDNKADLRSMVPVMCQFGADASASLPALLPTSETITIKGRECNVVLIPTAPVPVGGAIMYVPKEFVHPLDCGIDGLLNIYLSMGSTVPDGHQASG